MGPRTPINFDHEAFAKWVDEYCQANTCSKVDMCNRLGRGRTYITNLASGATGISRPAYRMLLNVFNLPAGTFLVRDDSYSSGSPLQDLSAPGLRGNTIFDMQDAPSKGYYAVVQEHPNAVELTVYCADEQERVEVAKAFASAIGSGELDILKGIADAAQMAYCLKEQEVLRGQL